MRRSTLARTGSWMLCPVVMLALGCSGGGPLGGTFTRRGVEREYISTAALGAARGLTFEDIIPIGARLTAVHVSLDGDRVTGIWTSYERNGVVKETPHRGQTGAKVVVLKLHRNEKLIGIQGRGRRGITGLIIATNLRTQSFGSPSTTTEDQALFKTITRENRHRYVGVGFTGRAGRELNELSLRIQVRQDELVATGG